MLKLIFVFVVLFLADYSIVESHSGGTNSDGCHTQKSTGDYHCHNPKKSSSNTSSSSVFNESNLLNTAIVSGTVIYLVKKFKG